MKWRRAIHLYLSRFPTWHAKDLWRTGSGPSPPFAFLTKTTQQEILCSDTLKKTSNPMQDSGEGWGSWLRQEVTYLFRRRDHVILFTERHVIGHNFFRTQIFVFFFFLFRSNSWGSLELSACLKAAAYFVKIFVQIAGWLPLPLPPPSNPGLSANICRKSPDCRLFNTQKWEWYRYSHLPLSKKVN